MTFLVSALFLTLVAMTTRVFSQEGTVIVDTEFGPVEGDIMGLHDGKVIQTFLGIPFAQSTAGAMRWLPPEDPTRWTEPFSARSLGAACPQLDNSILLTQPWWTDFSEDCLHLNVFAPLDQIGAPYPTMVFMYGGGFQGGANIQYCGHFLAAKDVVVVVPNYRLNILGFGTTSDNVAPGNFGLLDQMRALEWVQSNIRAFGGDPSNVVIFGESAGARSVGLQIVSPLTTDLFHGAIMQSGSDLGLSTMIKPEQRPEEYMQSVATQVNCHSEDNEEMISCLRDVDIDQLLNATVTCSAGFQCFALKPVIDNRFLPDLPENLRRAGNFRQVPVLMGINREDGFLSVADVIRNGVTQAEFENYVRGFVAALWDYGVAVPAERVEDVVQALLWNYSPWPNLNDTYANGQAVGNMKTEFSYGYAMDAQLKMQTDYVTSYQYIYGYTPDSLLLPDWLGCSHMLELPYVFGFPMLKLNDNVRNQTGIVDFFNYTEVDIAYSDFMMTLWTNFAKYRDPTPTAVEVPIVGGAPVDWGTFTKDTLNYIYIGKDVVEMRENYRQHYYAFWHSYLNWLINGEEWPFP